jgi:two-component system, OmpR family, response regulator
MLQSFIYQGVKMKILLLEDDAILQEIIEEYLTENSHEVMAFYDGEKALDAVAHEGFDLLLLDVNVPSIDGFEILAYLRDIGNTTPALYITSLADIKELKRGFEIGADDYLRKPFELEELGVRIDHIAKLYHLNDEIAFDSIRFNPKLHLLYIDDQEIEIRHKESAVLEYLIHNHGKVVSYDELIDNLWSDESIPTHATIRTYIKNIRKFFDAEYIQNVKGEGYRFNFL